MPTDITTTDRIFVPIVGTYFVLWVVGLIVFYPGKDAAFKRWWLPRYTIGAAVLFGCTVVVTVLASRSLWAMFLLVIFTPALIALITCPIYVHAKLTKICDRCGGINYPYWMHDPMTMCIKCGADLDAKKPAYDRFLE
jgi:hypothetical protein